MTSRELREAQFEQVRKGYDPDSVDSMLEKAADQIDTLTAEKQQNEQKMAVLAQKLEEYMAEEDKIRTTLLGAQKMSDTILREARQKAEIIGKDAAIKAERLVSAAGQKVEREEQSYVKIRAEVAKFKNDVLNIYKSHLEILSMIPEPESAAGESAAKPAESEAEPIPEPEVTAEQEVTAEPESTVAPEAAADPEAITEPAKATEPETMPEPEVEDEVEPTVEPEAEPESAAIEDKEQKPFSPFSAKSNRAEGERSSRRRNKFSELDFGDDFKFDND